MKYKLKYENTKIGKIRLNQSKPSLKSRIKAKLAVWQKKLNEL